MFLNNTQNKNQSNQSSNNQKTVQKSTQKVVQDQHCSNGIFFSLLSVFETIVLFHKKLLSADRQKQFGKYDAYSYDKKNLPQLHSQAHGMVIAFRATKKVFRQENQNHQWSLPKNYGSDKAYNYLVKCLKFYEQVYDSNAKKLCEDAIKILRDENVQRYNYQEMTFNNVYSPREIESFRGNIISIVNESQQKIAKILDEVNGCENVEGLTAQVGQKQVFDMDIESSTRQGYSDSPSKKSSQQVRHNSKAKSEMKQNRTHDETKTFVLLSNNYSRWTPILREGDNLTIQFPKNERKFDGHLFCLRNENDLLREVRNQNRQQKYQVDQIVLIQTDGQHYINNLKQYSLKYSPK